LWKISLIVVAILLGVSTRLKPFTMSRVELLGTVAQTGGDSSPANENTSLSAVPGSSGEPAPRRLSITLAVNNPDEILVKEGEKILNGQVIATNVKERERLVNQASQLKLAIAELSEPLPKPAPPPEPSYAMEEAAIESARGNLQFLEAQKEPDFIFKEEDLIQVFESQTLKEKQTIASRRMNGHFRLNEAIANLQEAKSNYQRELYQHQLKLLEIDQENRRRAAESISQGEKLIAVEKEISQLDFRSPYGGTVRKVKILGQNGRLLNVEILVINGDRRNG
jgi:hypothetical protein